MLRLFVWIASFLLIPSTAAAQVFVTGGFGFPLEPEAVTNLYGTGLTAGAGFSFEHTAYPNFRLRPFGSYQKFQIDDAQLQAEFEEVTGEVSGGDMSMIFGGADLQIRGTIGSVTPYVSPTIGMAMLAVDDIKVDDPDLGTITFDVQEEETAFAVGAGAGLAFAGGDRYEIFAEGHLMYAFTEGDNLLWIPVRAGVTLDLD